jgi:hypothetical protein
MRLADCQAAGTRQIYEERGVRLSRRLGFHSVKTPGLRESFDLACQEMHYAGACRRVGRRLRLAVMKHGEWVGGIFLGSPFPNIKVRDDAFEISRFARGATERGLASAWASENRDYWERLQLIVNHARAFVFPQYRGGGLGVMMHRLLETEGRELWEERYGPLAGFDTMCTDPNSRLFGENGWTLVGQTQGYSRDPSLVLSRRVAESKFRRISDNAALSRSSNSHRWWVWVRILTRIT